MFQTNQKEVVMIITDLKKSFRSKLKIDVYIDYECEFSLYESDIRKLNLKVSDEIDRKKLDDIIETVVKKNALNDGLRLISRTDYPSKVLGEKLAERNYPYEVISYVTEYLLERNYLDDYAYADKFIKNAFSSKKKGKAYVEMELLRKGIDKDVISELVFKYYNEDEIKIIAENKLKSILKSDRKPEIKDFMKLRDFLFRQGFSYDEISEALTLVKGKYED